MSQKNRSTIELIKCEMFKDIYIVMYLHQHATNEQVVRAIVSKIRGLDLPKQLRILPCVIYVFQNHPDKNLQRLLYELCEDNFARFLIIKWAFNAYTIGRVVSQQRLDEFDHIRNHIDSHAINGKQLDLRSIPEENLIEFISAWTKEKEQRAEFVVQINEFYCNLTKICLKLKNYLLDKRNFQLVYQLRRCFCKHLVKSYMKGIFFPVPEASNFIVNVIYDHCYTFSTKQRVPYKFVFETVDYKQLQANEKLCKFDMLETLPKALLQELSTNSEESFGKEPASEQMTPKQLEFNSKMNIFLAEARRADSLGQERQSMKPELKPTQLKLQHSFFEQDWQQKVEIIRSKSPYRELKSYQVRAYLVKAGDDLRQQFFSMQLIKMVAEIFTQMNLPLWIRPYDIIMLSRDEGFIQFLPNTMTISSLKKYGELNQIYKQLYADQYDTAVTNFVKSLAGYSLLCYIFQIKDRHNGNLLIDSQGHIIHIDFSFILSKCPGNIKFERAPFKLTADYIQLMGGQQTDLFKYFKQLLFIGLSVVRKYSNQIVKYVEVVRQKNDLQCFQYYDKSDFEKRLVLKLTDEELRQHVDNLVYKAYSTYTTSNYDRFQYYTNGIRH